MIQPTRKGGYILGAILVIGIVVAVTNVFPFRQIIAQNRQVEEARAELADLQGSNAQLLLQTEALRSPSEVERIAREDFGYVRPGDTSYVIVQPVDSEVVVVAEPAPEPELDSGGVLDAIWSYLTGRDLVLDG